MKKLKNPHVKEGKGHDCLPFNWLICKCCLHSPRYHGDTHRYVRSQSYVNRLHSKIPLEAAFVMSQSLSADINACLTPRFGPGHKTVMFVQSLRLPAENAEGHLIEWQAGIHAHFLGNDTFIHQYQPLTYCDHIMEKPKDGLNISIESWGDTAL